ncbi:MAG: T9SS type A sorting domain-containing protein [Ignavibacterium sp.]
MKKLKILITVIMLLFLVYPHLIFANHEGDQKDKGRKPKLQKVLADPVMSLMNINNASMWVNDNGFHDWVIGGGWNGAFPVGTTVGAIFAEGIVWGGIVNDGNSPTVRVNGNTYGSGTNAITRLFRVRPDYTTADLRNDAATFFQVAPSAITDADIAEIRNQYEKDWNEWPANLGAPFDDKNGNGTYEPTVDVPGIPGASQTIFILYDDSGSEGNYGSPPIGLKISETYWAYAVTGPLANVIFKKVNIIYTGTSTSAPGSTIDSMYIVQWADPDVGNSTDDFAGCDTVLNLGYAYSSKATDATYDGIGFPPPAVGYDFLSGVSKFTGDPNDSAIVDLKWKKGYKYINRKPMSSFVYFAAGGSWSDPSFNYNGTLQFYNLMRGKLPEPRYPSGNDFPPEVVDYAPDGTFLLAGDPVFGIGKIDGKKEGPGDRRIMVTNGPITMNLGDTAQVVLALVYGMGKNNLSSISTMKFNDQFAQFAFDQLFDVPVMPTPDISAVELDGKVSITWSNDQSKKNSIENSPHGPYEFEGYAVYQLPFGSTNIKDPNAVRIAIYDVVNNVSVLSDKFLDEATGLIYSKPVAFLDNTKGLQRFLTIDKDFLNNKALINGQSYTFAITAIGYNNDPGLPANILESSPAIVNVTPQSTKPGVRYNSVVGDTIFATHTQGGSDGSVFAVVVDPSQLKGHQYRVTFKDTTEGTVWELTDVTTNTVLLSNQLNQNGNDDYAIVDGMLIKVVGPPFAGVKDWDIPQGTRRFTWAGGADGLHFEGFNGALGYASPRSVFGDGVMIVTPAQLKNIVLRLASVNFTGDYEPPFDLNDPNVSYGYRYMRRASQPPAKPEFAPYILNPTGGYAFQEFAKNVPLSAWNVDDPNNPQRLAVGFLENNATDGLVDGKYWPGNNSLFDNTDADGPREWLFVFDAPYSETSDPVMATEIIGSDARVMYFATWARRGAAPFSPGGTGEDEFLILANKVNSVADVFQFSTPQPSYDANTAKVDLEKVNVFPNPYYGYHSRETAPNNKYVTFSHLPEKAVIRIFDLSGVLVRTINKNSSSQFQTWDLQNDNNLPVASGIYIVYIDMPDFGKTKVLKLAIINEQQMLKVY